ncbi:MAG: tRNA (adenosine(37)-N6)-threonylcarbamoyltransferase complex transferase subunit TsaD [Alphaproteobacteria bacterium]
MTKPLTVLGIETSCDETAAAIVRGTPEGARDLIAHQVLSQFEDHRPYGGVVPEIAARAHIDHLDSLIAKTLDEAGLDLSEIDGIAATAGPGLIGGVMVGLMTAKALAAAAGKPLIGVNHLEGHALSPRLTEALRFPYLLLLVSGGHCQLLSVDGVGKFTLYGSTLDDAVGEAFDKLAKMLGLPQPGGPAVERWAKAGDATRFKLPKPLINRDGCDFSFSGLKTAARREIETLGGADVMTEQDIADLCASFQSITATILASRTNRALTRFLDDHPQVDKATLVVAGGVAANQVIRQALADLPVNFVAPPLKLCTDNGAMIAWAGLERLTLGLTDPLEIAARARWPLDELTSAP